MIIFKKFIASNELLGTAWYSSFLPTKRSFQSHICTLKT